MTPRRVDAARRLWPPNFSNRVRVTYDGRAQSEKVKLLAQWPEASIAQFKASRISDIPAYLQQTEAHLYAGLRKAGIPKQ